MKLVFDSEVPPLQLAARTGNNITYPLQPNYLQYLRCNKCQKFAHAEKNCKSKKVVCPHCAGNHTHADCRSKQNKHCANCGLTSHGAAFHGCSVFRAYKHEVDQKNKIIAEEWELRKQPQQKISKTSVVVATPVSSQAPEPTPAPAPALAEAAENVTTTNPTTPHKPTYSEQEVKSLIQNVIRESTTTLLQELNKQKLLSTKTSDEVISQIVTATVTAAAATITKKQMQKASTRMSMQHQQLMQRMQHMQRMKHMQRMQHRQRMQQTKKICRPHADIQGSRPPPKAAKLRHKKRGVKDCSQYQHI